MKAEQLFQEIKKSIKRAKDNITAAESYLSEIEGQSTDGISSEQVIAKDIVSDVDENSYVGVFDGEGMTTGEGQRFPVPANYASKSKLVQFDKLKLSIKPDGAYVYKILEEVPRRIVVGDLILDGNQYKILTDDGAYKILYASVTFMRANFDTEVGDKISVLIPAEGDDPEWCAYDNVLPK